MCDAEGAEELAVGASELGDVGAAKEDGGAEGAGRGAEGVEGGVAEVGDVGDGVEGGGGEGWICGWG